MQNRQMKIIDGAPTAAIYARKSKATDKGESVENQISRCIALCDLREWGYMVFQDYDISGATLDRPEFELMMKKIHKGELQYLVCYKLDRVSRSTGDFSNLIKELDLIDVAFISIKENFDLSTPMGRAMMMVTSVFAQLERETIAERVRDNMIDRAKMGKWNGGPVPFGYDSETKVIENGDRSKKVSKLVINEEESQIVKEFYTWYLQMDGSVRNVVTKANELGYKTKNGAYWSHSQASRVLQSPLYCINDVVAYDYFKNTTEVNIVDSKDDYTSNNGLMYYNRRKQHKNTSKERDQEEWILAIGEHEGFIPGEMFSRVQAKLSRNKNMAPRTNQGIRSPLVGLVKCARCGLNMIVAGGKKTSDMSKGYYNYFRCQTREQRSLVLCDNNNMRADKLEDLVISHITSLLNNEKSLETILESSNSDIEDKRVPLIAKRNKLQSDLDKIDTEINNLVESLSKGILPEIIIKRKYKELENKKIQTRNDLKITSSELNNNYVDNFNLDTIRTHIKDFKNTYEYLNFDEKKKLLQSIIKEVSVDKDKVKLTLYFLPGVDFQDLDSLSDCSRKDMLVLAKHKILSIECTLDDTNNLPETTLGERLRKVRLESNLDMKTLAKLCNVASETISNIEKSYTNPNITTLNKLSQQLNSTNAYLLDTDTWKEDTQSEIIYKYRMMSGLSQKELAKRCDLHFSTIKDYEDGKISNPDTLKKIYNVIGYGKKQTY